jgi:hypothetical protein
MPFLINLILPPPFHIHLLQAHQILINGPIKIYSLLTDQIPKFNS